MSIEQSSEYFRRVIKTLASLWAPHVCRQAVKERCYCMHREMGLVVEFLLWFRVALFQLPLLEKGINASEHSKAAKGSHPQDKSLACSTRWALWTNWERTRSWSEIRTGCYKSARKNTNYGLGISDSVCGCTSSPCVCNVLRRWELHFMLGTCDAEWRERRVTSRWAWYPHSRPHICVFVSSCDWRDNCMCILTYISLTSLLISGFCAYTFILMALDNVHEGMAERGEIYSI